MDLPVYFTVKSSMVEAGWQRSFTDKIKTVNKEFRNDIHVRTI